MQCRDGKYHLVESLEPKDQREDWPSEEYVAEAYLQHSRALLAFARSMLSNPALAEEVVQDVFVRLATRPQSFDPIRGLLRTCPRSAGRRRAGAGHGPPGSLCALSRGGGQVAGFSGAASARPPTSPTSSGNGSSTR